MAKDKCSTGASRFRFRAWHKKRKRFLEPDEFCVQDGQACTDDEYNLHGGHAITPNKNLVLMQSTGLTDAAGKEIFEGDIIRGGGVTTVEWDANDLCWGNSKFCTRPHFAAWNVIGNIYEHPKLAK
jgi:uncharacterized phage protein (TIGR01671 family)